MYFSLIFQHLKLSLDVLALRLYIKILMNTQTLCIYICTKLTAFADKANLKASDAITVYGDAMTSEIEFRYSVKSLSRPKPRFEVNKL